MKPDETHPRSLSRVLPLVIVLTLLWGTNWSLFTLAVREVSVWTFRAICLIGSGLLLLAVARFRGISLRVPRHQRGPLVASALTYLVIWNVGSTYAALLIPSGQAAVLGYTMPVWATLLAWLVLGEKPSRRLIGSVFLAACGVALLAFAARRTYASAPAGFVLGIAAGLGWAGGTLILKRAALRIPSIVSTGWQLVIAAIPLSIVALALGTREAFVPTWTTFLVIGYMTVVPMALGNMLWFSIVDQVPASVSGLSTVMVPMLAMVVGALVRGEPLGPIQIAAMACCGGALLLALVRTGPRSRDMTRD
jgi:drug/metabolite transporter (DMT)-like permease